MWAECQATPGSQAPPVREPLPEGIEDMPGGPDLERLLAGLDRTELNGYELVILMRARARQLAHLQAEFYADMVELAHSEPCHVDDPPNRTQVMDEFASDEIRAALVWTRRAADYHLGLGWELVERLPQVWEALRRGGIDLPKAKVILDRTAHLDQDSARGVAASLLPKAGELTTGQIRVRLDRLCMESRPGEAKSRYEKGVEERRVEAERQPDGTGALLGFGLPADRVAAIMERLTRIAQKRKTADSAQTLDQVRADVFMELLEGRHQDDSPARRSVEIRVDLATLVGLVDWSADIPGWGPVISDIARRVVERQADGRWRFVVTDPDTGAVLANGLTRRRPTAAQRRHVESRQTTCSFPGCRHPSTDTDMDHSVEVTRGGPTLIENLGPACRHDHRLRHEGGWKFEQPAVGVYRWTSPHGHSYTTGRAPPG